MRDDNPLKYVFHIQLSLSAKIRNSRKIHNGQSLSFLNLFSTSP